MGPGTVYDAVGGAPTFTRLARALHARCLADPLLEHPFSHPGHPEHEARLAAYLGEVFGGPASYPGGHSAMLALHAGTGADQEYGDRFAACFAGALEDVGITQEPARGLLRAWMDTATAEVAAVSAAGSTVPDGLPTPRWSWDGPR